MGSRGKMYWTSVFDKTLDPSETMYSDPQNISGKESFGVFVDSVDGTFEIGYEAALEEKGPYIASGSLLTACISEPQYLRFTPVITPFIRFKVTNIDAQAGSIAFTLINRISG